MNRSIKALSAQHKRVQAKQAALFAKAYDLSTALREEFGAAIYATGTDLMLDQTGPGEGTYGRLSYDGEELRIIYRTTDEDLQNEAHGVPEDERGYHVRPLSSCSPKWLGRLLESGSVASLFESIGAVLHERETQVDESLGALGKLLAAESAEIDTQMTESLTKLNNNTLKQNWAEVLDATHLQTADGLTRSSRMLEAVCTAILNEGGVQSICNAVGSLRTHFGTAHGASSHLPPLDPEFGVLAKNACATAAIFLLSRHKQPLSIPHDTQAE